MVFWNKLLGMFSGEKAAVINEDGIALEQEVEVVKRIFPHLCVKGFTNFEQFFYDLHLSKAKHKPYQFAFLKKMDPCVGELVLKRSSPNLQTIKYCDSKDLANCSSKVR